MKHIIQADGILWEAVPSQTDKTKFELCNGEFNFGQWQKNNTRLSPGSLVSRRDVIIRDIIHSSEDLEKYRQNNAKQEKAKRDKIRMTKKFNTVLPADFKLKQNYA